MTDLMVLGGVFAFAAALHLLFHGAPPVPDWLHEAVLDGVLAYVLWRVSQRETPR